MQKTDGCHPEYNMILIEFNKKNRHKLLNAHLEK